MKFALWAEWSHGCGLHFILPLHACRGIYPLLMAPVAIATDCSWRLVVIVAPSLATKQILNYWRIPPITWVLLPLIAIILYLWTLWAQDIVLLICFLHFVGFDFSSLLSFMIRPKRQLHASFTVTVEERIDSEGNSFRCHYVMCWWQMSPNIPGVHFSIRVMQHGCVPLLPSCLTSFRSSAYFFSLSLFRRA